MEAMEDGAKAHVTWTAYAPLEDGALLDGSESKGMIEISRSSTQLLNECSKALAGLDAVSPVDALVTLGAMIRNVEIIQRIVDSLCAGVQGEASISASLDAALRKLTDAALELSDARAALAVAVDRESKSE